MVSYVAFFPNLPEDHWINQFRNKYDTKGALVPPHMTLVYPTNLLTSEELENEVGNVASHFKKFQVKLVTAKFYPGQDGNASVFLVPSVGFSEVLELHGLLHSGVLKQNLKTDSLFIPHLTVASEMDFVRARFHADVLSSKDFEVEFTFDSLTVVEIPDPEGKRVLKTKISLS
jgi:2'-5' RNA ligase